MHKYRYCNFSTATINYETLGAHLMCTKYVHTNQQSNAALIRSRSQLAHLSLQLFVLSTAALKPFQEGGPCLSTS